MDTWEKSVYTHGREFEPQQQAFHTMIRRMDSDVPMREVNLEETRARLKALASMPDDDIDYSDIPEMTDERMNNGVFIRNPWMEPPTKTTLARVQIDSDIIFWIIRQVGEEGYQEKGTLQNWCNEIQ